MCRSSISLHLLLASLDFVTTFTRFHFSLFFTFEYIFVRRRTRKETILFNKFEKKMKFGVVLPCFVKLLLASLDFVVVSNEESVRIVFVFVRRRTLEDAFKRFYYISFPSSINVRFYASSIYQLSKQASKQKHLLHEHLRTTPHTRRSFQW